MFDPYLFSHSHFVPTSLYTINADPCSLYYHPFINRKLTSKLSTKIAVAAVLSTPFLKSTGESHLLRNALKAPFSFQTSYRQYFPVRHKSVLTLLCHDVTFTSYVDMNGTKVLYFKFYLVGKGFFLSAFVKIFSGIKQGFHMFALMVWKKRLGFFLNDWNWFNRFIKPQILTWERACEILRDGCLIYTLCESAKNANQT